MEIARLTYLRFLIGNLILLFLSLLIFRNSTDETNPRNGRENPREDLITRNADWTPVIQRFNNVQMVLVPAGCFMMGSAIGADAERPVHEQCFYEPFWIDQYEVSNDQFGSWRYFDGDNRPRVGITWFEAQAYCERRGARLPTEREWEYAARGPDNLLYPWGNQILEDYALYDMTSNFQTGEVDAYQKGVSWVGAYQMSGNVWEWVSSLYWGYPYRETDGREEIPQDITQADTRPRGVRGGSWFTHAQNLRATFRGGEVPTTSTDKIGFRCARSG
jgi:formylglycine-generating enzyme required for sulfatase activity